MREIKGFYDQNFNQIRQGGCCRFQGCCNVTEGGEGYSASTEEGERSIPNRINFQSLIGRP